MIKKYIAKNKIQIAVIVSASVIMLGLASLDLSQLMTNTFSNLKAPAFDGTVSPVKQIPNWVALTSTEWKASFDEIPAQKKVSLPDYVPSQLYPQLSKWNSDSEKTIRNAQITYSVPYMGNYRLDGKENAGSHLAVDMKLPMNTPIHAIANGVVIKVARISSGFGQHIVVRHSDVPSLENESQKTTYYSSYSHLSNILVSEGEIVKKDQMIAKSGNSGVATTPHLHFQIDKDTAPWYPYWPFTSKEASDAGLDFFGAINSGLGKDKALANTINPMLYVQKYRNNSGSSATSSTSGSSSVVVDTPVSTTPVVNNNTTPIVNTNVNTQPNNDQLPPVSTSSTATPVIVTPTVNNSNTEVPVVTEPVIENIVNPVVETVEVEAKVIPDRFELKTDSGFTVNQAKVIKVLALDASGNILEKYKPENYLYVKVEAGSAKMASTMIGSSDFSNGIADVIVTPTANFGLQISVSDGQRIATTEILKANLFSDITEKDNNYQAIAYLTGMGVIKGYPDGKFKPSEQVTRVEALKMIFEAMEKDSRRVILEYKDTDTSAWYAPYVATATQKGIVKGYAGNQFKPANPVTRAEFLKMLVLTSEADSSKYKNRPSYNDVKLDEWFSEYFAYAKSSGWISNTQKLIKPNEPISRGEVADILYNAVLTAKGRAQI